VDEERMRPGRRSVFPEIVKLVAVVSICLAVSVCLLLSSSASMLASLSSLSANSVRCNVVILLCCKRCASDSVCLLTLRALQMFVLLLL